MGRSAIVCLFAVILGGCGREADFSGPAPAGALECALAHARAAGYDTAAGSIDDGFLRLTQRVPAGPATPPPEPRPDLGDVVLSPSEEDRVENELIVEVVRGRLHIGVLGVAETGAEVAAGSSAQDHARTILALCTTSPPVFPDG